MILKCTCENEYQDKKYGLKLRVFNELKLGTGKARCTVCGKIEVINKTESKENKEKDK